MKKIFNLSLIFVVLFFCFSPMSIAYYSYSPVSISSFSWSQTKTGIHLSITTKLSYGNYLFCHDAEQSTVKKIAPANSCGLNIVVHTRNVKSRKVIPINTNIGVKSSGAEAANVLSSLRYLSREALKISNSDIIESVCVSYYYSDNHGSVSDMAIAGVCAGDPVIPPSPYPESCDVILDNNVIDFGDIGDKEFSDAGVGNKPVSVKPQTRTLKVECTDNDPSTTKAYLMLTTDKSSNKMIISSNDDVGFVIEDLNKEIIYPNDFSKILPFMFDNEKKAEIPIVIQPVSTTGKTPKVGVFNATAVLDVIFD